MSHSVAFFAAVTSTDCGKPVKEHGLKFYTNVALYDEQTISPRIVSLVSVSGADMTDANEFLLQFHGVYLNRALGADLIITEALELHIKSFFFRISSIFFIVQWRKF